MIVLMLNFIPHPVKRRSELLRYPILSAQLCLLSDFTCLSLHLKDKKG